MSKEFSYGDTVEMSLAYVDAVSACWDANCSLADSEVEDSYIRNRLYFAMYNMTEFLLSLKKARLPEALEHRMHRVRDLYGKEFIPYLCNRLVDREAVLYRNELAAIGQTMDDWFSTVCRRYSDAVVPEFVHAFVC